MGVIKTESDWTKENVLKDLAVTLGYKARQHTRSLEGVNKVVANPVLEKLADEIWNEAHKKEAEKKP